VDVGTPVLAMGNEAGQGGSPTVAPGVISNVNRTIEASDQSSGLNEVLHGMLQTNADIRPGDSGGPLANAAGQVIGIDTAAGGSKVYSGYAIPINQALAIASQIAAGHGDSSIKIGLPAFLGALVPDSSSSDPRRQASQEQQHAKSTSGSSGGGSSSPSGPSGIGNVSGSDCSTGDTEVVPASIAPARSGALVDGVLCGTVAASAGIFAGDVITSIGGRAVTTPASLNNIIARYHPDETAKVTWISPDGSWHSAFITLSVGPAG
jgi:S1-C subfamily serine protease